MQNATCNLKYRRILLKLSGEGLMGRQNSSIDPDMLAFISSELEPVIQAGAQVGIVVGGGNLFRGKALCSAGMSQVTGDQMGMLATVMNSLALSDALNRSHIRCTVMSAFAVGHFTRPFNKSEAVSYIADGGVAIFSGGTGNPFFTTDTAACLRGIEINADLVIKATKVDGVYDSDPVVNPAARMYETLTYDDVIKQRLSVMDLTAVCLMKDHAIPLRVFNMNKAGALLRVLCGENEGTLIKE